ncbi:MAG: glucosidase [Acidobacteria bacterium]|nr:MAG: glucosidase [Acidobacteriota bacterium]REJ99153.1 MAG: glucosidase [Acidobacteriota bacterium]REK16126.1 MAG: glucosidase [Acidobacteriota bacterium]REK43807.1 MAG: glucosidase [Acidobacteriota bacterium]
MAPRKTKEQGRLDAAVEHREDWKLWGPYVSERAWGTVREDYSADGSAWHYFPFSISHKKTYRWNEDGIAGISDRRQKLCFSVAMWNGKDPVLKERLFGVSGPEGNHGEDVKEYYYHLDSTPTHSYLKFLYKYPQAEFPYKDLLERNRQRGRDDEEYELIDTGLFDDNRYFDVLVEYAKAGTHDICIRITVTNRGPEEAQIDLLPTLWFRNTWSWSGDSVKPVLQIADSSDESLGAVQANEPERGIYWLLFDGANEVLFTGNETNFQDLYGSENDSPYTKDAFHKFVVEGDLDAIDPSQKGTKCAVRIRRPIKPGKSEAFHLRLSAQRAVDRGSVSSYKELIRENSKVFKKRISEADEFYQVVIPGGLEDDAKDVMRKAFSGLMWSKQFYHYAVEDWIDGDPVYPKPPASRRRGRNAHWRHLHTEEVLLMPDKWEYPWFASWDLAFHCIPAAMIDPDFSKRQLLLLLREWYMHPNGQIPAYEWSFDDVNPPVHAFAALQVYRIEKRITGREDREFLEKVFHKLLLNFTWWVNRKDSEGDNVFEGGFLGLDNIGVFDRSRDLPTGGHLEQSDGTSWMAMFSLNMLAIALELALEDSAYEDVASKFFEHFIFISDAMNNVGHEETELWSERDGFYYDVLHLPDGYNLPMRIRSLVGLIPLFAVEVIEEQWLERLPAFRRRTEWFIENRKDLIEEIACLHAEGVDDSRLLSLVNRSRLERLLRIMFSEQEFLSDYGIRSLSRDHKTNPYFLLFDGREYRVDYEPGESRTGSFGGNSNWRGPVWFPINFLVIEALEKYHSYYGDGLKIELPTGTGRMVTLNEAAEEIGKRLSSLFLKDKEGNRPVFGNEEKFLEDPEFGYPLFYEYFHGDNGKGLGASHQTGWTALVACILEKYGS